MLLDALVRSGVGAIAVACSMPDGFEFHPPSARTPMREAAVEAAIAMHASGAPTLSSLRVLCNGVGTAAVLVAPEHLGFSAFTPAQQRLLALAGRRLGELLASNRLQASVAGLAQAEQLQRALFAIADMAGSDLDMPSLLRGLHQIIGRADVCGELLHRAASTTSARPCSSSISPTPSTTDGPRPDEEVPLARWNAASPGT